MLHLSAQGLQLASSRHAQKMEELEAKLDWNIDFIFIGTVSITIILFLLFNLVISVDHSSTPHIGLSQHSFTHFIDFICMAILWLIRSY